MNHWPDSLLAAADETCVLVRVQATRGSTPREVGAWMAVFTDRTLGSVGGGHLEWQAIGRARALLARGQTQAGSSETHRYALGPSLGQCCGGDVHLEFQICGVDELRQRTANHAAPLARVALFGGGHVGQALIGVFSRLSLQLRWIDSRDGIFPASLQQAAVCEQAEPVHHAVADLLPGSLVLIMSFSHAEDLDVVAACLARRRLRADLPFIGLIGSQTKWARFRRRLRERGYTDEELDFVTCPIGVPGILGKEPEVIAVSVAAQILMKIRG